jgi:hypothetical protein
MKTMLWSVILAALTLHSCIEAQNKVNGEGSVVTKEITVQPFNSLVLKCATNVEIIQSNGNKVTIEADENLLQFVDIKNEGDKLMVKTKSKVQFRHYNKFIIRVHVSNLSSIDNSGVGNVKSLNTLMADKLKLNLSSVGNNNFDINANKIDVTSSTVGNVTLSGEAALANIDHSGVGNADFSALKVKILHVKSSAMGNIKVYASDEIYIRHSGVGNISYSGDARVMELNSSGVGSTKKL